MQPRSSLRDCLEQEDYRRLCAFALPHSFEVDQFDISASAEFLIRRKACWAAATKGVATATLVKPSGAPNKTRLASVDAIGRLNSAPLDHSYEHVAHPDGGSLCISQVR